MYVLAEVRRKIPPLNPAHHRIAAAAFEDPDHVFLRTVSDVGEAACEGAAAVVRSCKRVGFRSYMEPMPAPHSGWPEKEKAQQRSR